MTALQIAQNTTAAGATSASVAAQTSDPVNEAVDSINDRLSTSWNDWAISRGDVNAIANTLEGLNASQTRQVIEQLDQNGNLGVLAQEFTDDKIAGLGGLNVAERSNFFNEMARKLDSAGLKLLSDAFAGTDSNSGGYEDVTALGQAVASHASTNTQVEYVQAMAADMTDQPDYTTTHFGGAMTRVGDAEAAAVAEVLAGLKGNAQASAEAFGSLDNAQLKAVMAASVGETLSYSQGGVAASLDASLAQEVLNSASRIGDADLKARVFDAGGQILGHIDSDFGFPVAAIGRGDAATDLAAGLTEIIGSDTTGVMRELAYNSESMDGQSFGHYAKQLLNDGQHDILGEQMAKLQLGNGLNENPVERFEATVSLNGGVQRYENAGTLGYFVGGVYSGAESISQDVKAQQEQVTAVLSSTLGILDKVALSGSASLAVTAGSPWVSMAVKGAIEDPGPSAAQQLERAAIPIDPSTNEVGVGTGAFSGFNDRVSQVLRLGE